MKRVIVIGCPGSGKSSFSRALCQKTGLPLCHLDLLYWNADKTTVEKSVFLARLSTVLKEDAWIIDGNYASTMEMRMAACDTVFFLDYPLAVCLDGVRARRGKPRSDMPWIEGEEDAELIEMIKGFRVQQRPQVMALLEKYRDKNVVVFQSREQADAFLRHAVQGNSKFD
ncbi:MAG: adenylate kinase [Clostridia bacterium]|nr:adenylate kinase [Clostridia bacterium]